jgi:outer membrane murein-binding lipoprotein Lpp
MRTKLNILIAMVLLSVLVITGCNKTEKASSVSSDYSQEIMKKGGVCTWTG